MPGVAKMVPHRVLYLERRWPVGNQRHQVLWSVWDGWRSDSSFRERIR